MGRYRFLHKYFDRTSQKSYYSVIKNKKKIYIYMKIIKNQKSKIKNQKSKIKNQKSKIKNQKSKIKNQKSKIKNQKSNI
jgi:hypothetical protein